MHIGYIEHILLFALTEFQTDVSKLTHPPTHPPTFPIHIVDDFLEKRGKSNLEQSQSSRLREN